MEVLCIPAGLELYAQAVGNPIDESVVRGYQNQVVNCPIFESSLPQAIDVGRLHLTGCASELVDEPEHGHIGRRQRRARVVLDDRPYQLDITG